MKRKFGWVWFGSFTCDMCKLREKRREDKAENEGEKIRKREWENKEENRTREFLKWENKRENEQVLGRGFC